MAPALAQDVLNMSSGVRFGGSKNDKKDSFHSLVDDLCNILGPSSGLTSDDVDVSELRRLMEDYISEESEWQKYAFADLSRGYTRNLVDEGNGKSNLLVLVWTPGKGSPVHDHADAHCLMKVLRGSLVETRYDFPDTPGKGPRITKETTYHTDQVTYMSDELGVHKIWNPDPSVPAVSLHLYTPPNAERMGCHIFDERTGRRSHISQANFYSVHGRKVDQ